MALKILYDTESNVNFNKKNLKFTNTDNPNIKWAYMERGVTVAKPPLDIPPNRTEENQSKPIPKYSKKEILHVGEKKQVPDNWKTIADTTKFSQNNGNSTMVAQAMGAPPPSASPGPCCMNDLYVHELTNSFASPYIWNAIAGGYSPTIYATVPQSLSGVQYWKYNIINPLNGEFVNGVFNFSLESGMPNNDPGAGSTGPVSSSGTLDNKSVEFSSYSEVTWYGRLNNVANSSSTASSPANRKMVKNWSSKWAFPKFIFDNLSHGQSSPGLQTQIDWGNSVTAYSTMNSGYNLYYNYEYVRPDIQEEEFNIVPIHRDLGTTFLTHFPFCQGRALLNPGVAHYPNPWPGKSWSPTATNTGRIDKPRRMGWEGWVLRPHNVSWNWGNRGAYVDTLHYTLGCSEDSTSPANASGSYTDTWGNQHQRADNINSFDKDGKTCAKGYCSYPQPSILSINSAWYSPNPSYFYKSPHIEGSQLEHQKVCCANSQWFQNARVLRNYDEEVWWKIGSPFAGGSTGLTFSTNNGGYTMDITNMTGENGNGPPPGDPTARYSCTTVYVLNRILQYISSSSDFEEIQARDFGTKKDGSEESGMIVKRMWFPVQSGYYNKNTSNINDDDPWENLHRIRDIGNFYVMINLCGYTANESLSLGSLGNLGNPPLAQIDTVDGLSKSKLNPGIWPWGHCITYACGNPEYSLNYDSGTTANGNPQITYNKLGERGCEAQTPWASMPLNYYYSNVTFAGIKVFFFDETIRGMSSKMFTKWSFSNSNEWTGQVPTTYEEASKSAIGFMMWLGHNSWDYNMVNPAAYPNSDQSGLYGPSVGRPAGSSGGTGIEYWEPVETDTLGNPVQTGHFVFDLNNTTVRASTNGYYKGIRPNYTYLDVVTHLLEMEKDWEIKYKNYAFDYNNRPEGVPEYNAGVPVPGTYKTNNPVTGIPYDWYTQQFAPGEMDGSPSFYDNDYLGQYWCNYFPGEDNANPWNNYTNPYGGGTQVLPPPTDPSWNGLKDGPGNPGGGNYCTQDYMLSQTTGPFQSTSYNPGGPYGPCSNWTFGGVSKPIWHSNYIWQCFYQGWVGTNYVKMPTPPTFGTVAFRSGDVRGEFQGGYPGMGAHRIGCMCFPWYSYSAITNYTPQLMTGPHCEGCNVGCCTNEFNSFNACEYVYPQGLFKSKNDCARAQTWEQDTIPTSMVPAFFAQQNATTPIGRRKTYTSPLWGGTFCKSRPQGNPGCLNPNALNYSPSHTEDCGGSVAWTYRNAWNLNAGLSIYIDDSCCELTVPGWKCDVNVDSDNDGNGDCLQTCTYGATPISLPWGGTFYMVIDEAAGCYSAKTCTPGQYIYISPGNVGNVGGCCEDNCGPYNPTTLPGYSCNYPSTPHGCAQNCTYNVANPTAACPHSSLTDCESANGGSGSPYCGPTSAWYCTGTPLSVVPFNQGNATSATNSNQAGWGTNVSPNSGGASFYTNACQWSSNIWQTNTQVLYGTIEDCQADCCPCMGTGSQDWCDNIIDELVNQFGTQATEADLYSTQFKDPNPTNQPFPYSSIYDSSWWFKYTHCCQGRLGPSRYTFNHANENSYSGLVPFGGTASDGATSFTPKTGLGNVWPSPGNNIHHDYTSPAFWCDCGLCNPDYNTDYTTSGALPYEWVNGQGYRCKSSISVTNGPNGVCEGEQCWISHFEFPMLT